MNKKLIMAGLILLAASSCSNESENTTINDETLVPVCVHVNDFSVSQQDLPVTRANTAVTAYAGIKGMTLAFYKTDGTLQYSASQQRATMPGGKTFGEFSLSLPMGSYTMVVLAYGSNFPMTLNSMAEAVFDTQEARVRETFIAKQTVDVTTNSARDLTATLSRVISKLQLNSSDGRIADVKNVRMTFSAGGQAVNPLTGFASTNAGFSNTVSVSADPGTTSSSVSYLFLATDEQTMNVTIETLDADGNPLFSKTVNDVPFKRNRLTQLTGKMYTSDVTAVTFEVNDEWLDDASVNF